MMPYETICDRMRWTLVQAARTSGRHPVRDAAIILMMFRHGLRTAELVTLRWHQVDLKAGYLDVHRVKRGHDAKHPLRGSAAATAAGTAASLP